MEINHFSHEHPLSILNKEAHKNENCNEVVCYGCGIPIADCDDDENSTAYECGICNFFLHKRCAEAPTQLLHPMHSQHPLTLLSHPSYPGVSTCICSLCNRDDWKWFTYNCSQCQFDVDIVCALDTICALKEDRRFENTIHQHPLTLQLRPALFHCDACGTKSEDYSYQCTTCQFWIHKTCALLPSTIKLSHHKHTLKLAYSLPDMHRGYRYNCDICGTSLLFYYWLYYCGNCRYFVHVKCATTSDADPEPLLQRDDEDHKKLDLFPIPDDRSADLMTQFVKKISLGDADCDRGEVEIDHWSHNDHRLLLWDNQSKNELNADIVYDGMFCAACMQPIMAPFYHCSQCSYFLHKYCALLPLELQYPGHPDHPLNLGSVFTMFVCASCRTASSGFFYGCETCSFFIDIGCVSLPTKILHESHAHPLVTSPDSKCLCNACDQWFSGFAYKCETCSYKLMYRCATMLPRTVTHEYDEHPIYLTYDPIENHPSEFYCEICEEEIHPKFWLYYCQKCSYSFHTDCIRPLDLYSNVKFGGIHEVDNHQHPLTLVRNGRNKSPCPCGICCKDKKGDPILECSECGFKICLECDG